MGWAMILRLCLLVRVSRKQSLRGLIAKPEVEQCEQSMMAWQLKKQLFVP
jgi:hypothetical protein